MSTHAAKADAAGIGAPPANEATWEQIDWDQVNEEVTRLQARIAKATQAGRWNKVQALQHLLTHSRSGKLLAVRRVTENKGKRTAGVDGQIWSTPMSKLNAARSLTHRGYQPLPLRRAYIPKSNGRSRPLGIPSMFDRAMQALWLAEQLEQVTILTEDTGTKPKEVTVDLGFRGVDAANPDVQIIHRGKFKSLTDAQRRWLKRRQAVEPAIGHLKHDNAMDRCWLKGQTGDALHAVLCAAGYNIRWLLRAVLRRGLKGLFAPLFALLAALAAALATALGVRTTGADRRAWVAG